MPITGSGPFQEQRAIHIYLKSCRGSLSWVVSEPHLSEIVELPERAFVCASKPIHSEPRSDRRLWLRNNEVGQCEVGV